MHWKVRTRSLNFRRVVLNWTGLFVIALFGTFGNCVNDGRRQFCSLSRNEEGLNWPIFFFLKRNVSWRFWRFLRKILGKVFLRQRFAAVNPWTCLKQHTKARKNCSFRPQFLKNEHGDTQFFSHIWNSHETKDRYWKISQFPGRIRTGSSYLKLRYTSIVPEKVQDLRPSLSFTKSSIWPEGDHDKHFSSFWWRTRGKMLLQTTTAPGVGERQPRQSLCVPWGRWRMIEAPFTRRRCENDRYEIVPVRKEIFPDRPPVYTKTIRIRKLLKTIRGR